MNIEIKVAQPGDFKQVYNLIKEFAKFIGVPETVKNSPEQMLKDQKYFNCLIATNQEKIIGFATFFYAYYSWTGKAVYLDDLYVLEEYRGKGIGSKLFDKILTIGKEENCLKIRWQVSNWNKKAQEFYKNKGATIDEIELNCDLSLDNIT